ncbi:hypothetical protein ACWD04_28080 [Streptomyces sp. NPDC002911]
MDRLGRNVVDCLNTGYKMRDEKKMLVTYGHDGPWELDDPADENRFTMEAWGAQMELRAIQRRNPRRHDKDPGRRPAEGQAVVRLPVRAQGHGGAGLTTSNCTRIPPRCSEMSPVASWPTPRTSPPAVKRPASTVRARHRLRTTWPRCTESRPEGARGPHRA